VTIDHFDTIFLGYVRQARKTKRVYGPYVEVERGFTTHSPCYVWLGGFRNGRPYIRTNTTSRSVRRMLMQLVGERGLVYPECGHDDCVNPQHLVCVKQWEEKVGRDTSTGRFISVS
jgi:hypothetical protein